MMTNLPLSPNERHPDELGTDWTLISEEPPPENVEVLTCICDERSFRNCTQLRREGNLYFGGHMYVYYTPTHWKHLPAKTQQQN